MIDHEIGSEQLTIKKKKERTTGKGAGGEGISKEARIPNSLLNSDVMCDRGAPAVTYKLF